MEHERQHYNVTLAILAAAGTAYSLLQTMVVPALPALQRDLHTTTTWVTWVLTGFLLVSAVATPMLGKLGDQHGKERMLLITLGVFLVGTIGCAAAWNIWSLIAFRGLQGAAGAIFPLSFGIIRDEFPPEKVATGIGLISAVFGVGGGAGIMAAGLIVDHLSWRWLFILPSFVIAAAAVLVWRFVPESPIKKSAPVDVPGALTLSVGLISLLLALTEGDHWGWTSARVLGLFALAVVGLATWVQVERRVAEPLVDMTVFSRRPVLVTNATALISGFALLGSFVLVPTLVETPRGLSESTARLVHYGFGASATQAGLYLVPSSATILFSGPIAGMVGRKIGMKWPLSFGMLMLAAVCASLGMWHDHPWQIVVAMAFLGVAFGSSFAAMTTLIAESVPLTETGIATGMNTVMRTVGSQIGAQIGAAILVAYTIGRTGVPSEKAFQVAFGVSAGVALVGGVLALFVTPFGRRRRELAPSLG